jgi:2-polyprenyl-6-methoxyphenol hydroxylase-like FAD-dependent oxidoreductase
MEEQIEKQADVMIMGTGPVGLPIALELSLGGVRALVLEHLAHAWRRTERRSS